MKIASWNVNGIRACAKKGYFDWMANAGAQIVGLQETRAHVNQLSEDPFFPKRWCAAFTEPEKKGYSGVGIYSRKKPDLIETSLGVAEYDAEGRYMRAEFGALVVINAYFPNGAGKNRDNSRIPYKLGFTQAVRNSVEKERARGRPIIVMGDFNTAHEAIDLARPKNNVKTTGFTPIEREEITAWIDGGWTDTFRHFEKGPEHYTWWSQRGDVRERNVGWRIDYVMASEGAMPFVKKAYIERYSMGSDHCPIGIEVDNKILDVEW